MSSTNKSLFETFSENNKLQHNLLFSNSIDNFIYSFPNFLDTSQKNDNFLNILKVISIQFTLKQVWDMHNSLLLFLA